MECLKSQVEGGRFNPVIKGSHEGFENNDLGKHAVQVRKGGNQRIIGD